MYYVRISIYIYITAHTQGLGTSVSSSAGWSTSAMEQWPFLSTKDFFVLLRICHIGCSLSHGAGRGWVFNGCCLLAWTVLLPSWPLQFRKLNGRSLLVDLRILQHILSEINFFLGLGHPEYTRFRWFLFSSGRDGWSLLFAQTSQPLLRAARRNSAASIFRFDLTRGGRQRLTGRPRLSSFHTLTFLTTYTTPSALKCKRSRTPQCGEGECLLNLKILCFDFDFSALISSIVNITLAWRCLPPKRVHVSARTFVRKLW